MNEVNRITRENLARWLALHEAKWGPEVSREKWLNNIVEECAELIQAVQHYKRKRVPLSKVRTEMADVSINIDILLTIEDENGPPITEDIARIAQYQVDVLAGVTPQIHNDGEDEPPNPIPDNLVVSYTRPCKKCGGKGSFQCSINRYVCPKCKGTGKVTSDATLDEIVDDETVGDTPPNPVPDLLDMAGEISTTAKGILKDLDKEFPPVKVRIESEIPEKLITSADFKQILAYYGYSGARIDRSEDGLRWVFYAPESQPVWSAIATEGIKVRMPTGLQVSFYPFGVEVPDSASEH